MPDTPLTDAELLGMTDPAKNGPILIRMALELIEARKDQKRLDWIADDRTFDGIGDLDIDELTLEAVTDSTGECSEERWNKEWRVQMRVAIDTAMEASK